MNLPVLSLLLILCLPAHAQNLVADGDFSQKIGKDSTAEGWHRCTRVDTPDFFEESDSSRIFRRYRGGTRAKKGSSYLGMFVYRKVTRTNTPDVREFVCGRLTVPLKKDSIYSVRVFLKADEECNVECDGFSVHFSPVHVYCKPKKMFELPPHVSLPPRKYVSRTGWTELKGNYRARGNEQFVVLGNLKPDANTIFNPVEVERSRKKDKWDLKPREKVAYFYVDDLSVTINDSLNRIAARKAEEKKIAKLKESRLKDSLKKIRQEELAKAPKKIPITKDLLVPKAPVQIDSVDADISAPISLPMIQFETNRADFKAEAIDQLNELLMAMRRKPEMEIEVRGHTDNAGNTKRNLQLSIERARAVADYLIRNGIAAERIQTQGFGSSQPVESNATEEGRAANRRIEIFILND